MANGSRSDARIRDGYAARAGEYTELFGDIGQMDDVDREHNLSASRRHSASAATCDIP